MDATDHPRSRAFHPRFTGKADAGVVQDTRDPMADPKVQALLDSRRLGFELLDDIGQVLGIVVPMLSEPCPPENVERSRQAIHDDLSGLLERINAFFDPHRPPGADYV